MARQAFAAFAMIAVLACSPEGPASESSGDAPVASGSDASGSGLPPDTPVSSTGDLGVAAPVPPGDSVSPGSGGGGTSGTPAPSGGTRRAGQPVAEPAPPAAADAQDMDAVIARATSAYNSARTARGSFTQTIFNPQTGSRVNARGTFMRRQPDRFAFDFTDPAGDRIVADGRYVWLYLPSTNPGQVLRSTLTPSSAGSYDLGSLFFERTRERFNVSDGGNEVLDGTATRILELTPRGSAPFARAKVWVDATTGNLRQFTVVDGMGLERTVRITSYSANVSVPDSAFEFEPPPGVRVVDAESLGG